MGLLSQGEEGALLVASGMRAHYGLTFLLTGLALLRLPDWGCVTTAQSSLWQQLLYMAAAFLALHPQAWPTARGPLRNLICFMAHPHAPGTPVQALLPTSPQSRLAPQ